MNGGLYRLESQYCSNQLEPLGCTFWFGLEPGGGRLNPSPRLAFTVLHFMAKSNKVVPKKGRGRPATGRDPVTAIRLSKELRETVDKWADKQDDKPGRSEAIRRLVEIGLKAKK